MKTPSIATTKAVRAQAALDAFSSQYHAYQYQFVEFFVDHLVDLTRTFRGDLHQVLVLAILGQVKLQAVRDAVLGGMTPAEAVHVSSAISASRVADITAIPRQTVRRKLMALERMGWATQNDDQTWSLAASNGPASVRDDLGGVDSRALARVARLFAELEDIVGRAG